MDAEQKGKLQVAQRQVDELKDVATHVLQGTLNRGDTLNVLGSKAQNLQRESDTFKQDANRVRRKSQKAAWFLPVCFFILLALVIGIALPILGYPALGGLILGSFLTNPPLWAIIGLNAIVFGAAAGLLALVFYTSSTCECAESLPSICSFSRPLSSRPLRIQGVKRLPSPGIGNTALDPTVNLREDWVIK